MQTGRLLQTVVLMLLVAMAASCAAGKAYSSRIFPPRDMPAVKAADTSAVALRFLDIDTSEAEKVNWVSTDLIMGRDTSNSNTVLENFSRTYPASASDTLKKTPVKEPVKNTGPLILAERSKKEETLAKSYDPTPVRSKKTREQP